MYGQNQYGQSGYSDDRRDSSDRDQYYIDLMKLVPEFVTEKVEMRELYTSQGFEIGYLRHVLDDMIDQCFIATATWGLARWEKMFGVSTNLFLTYEQRREVLKARICGQGTTTIQMVKDTAAAFSGGEVDVIEDNAHSRFIVRFISIKGIPRNMQGFIAMLEQIKPAHLACEFEYRYTTWNEVKPYAWDGLKDKTWDYVRIMEEA